MRFQREENRREADASDRRALARCKSKKLRDTTSCKRLLKKTTASRRTSSICGRRYARARRGDTADRLARRSGVSRAALLRLNHLPSKTGALRRGKRYLVYRSPLEGDHLAGGVLMVAETGLLRMQRPERGWGKPIMVAALRSAAEAVRDGEPRASQLVIGDLSKQGGGCLPPHRSHRGGLDADVGYYRVGGQQRSWLGLTTPEDIDSDRTWQFIDALRASGALRYAFIDYGLQPSLYAAALRAGYTERSLAAIFQYPRAKEADKQGVIRHLNGHADHMHLRLVCPDGSDCLLAEAKQDAVRLTQITQRGSVGRETRPVGVWPGLAPRRQRDRHGRRAHLRLSGAL